MDSYQKFEDAIVEHWGGAGHLERASALLVRCRQSHFWKYPCWRSFSRWRCGMGAAPTGSLAKALDMRVAEELRAAGFDAQSVWPRLVRPRVLDPSVLRFIAHWMQRTAEKCCRGPSSLCQRQRQRARVDLLQAGRCGAILLDDGS